MKLASCYVTIKLKHHCKLENERLKKMRASNSFTRYGINTHEYIKKQLNQTICNIINEIIFVGIVFNVNSENSGPKMIKQCTIQKVRILSSTNVKVRDVVHYETQMVHILQVYDRSLSERIYIYILSGLFLSILSLYETHVL